MHLLTTVPPNHNEIDSYDNIYLVMPKMDRNLSQVIRSKQEFTERHLQYIIFQILAGLSYLHSANIMHRDLKPENIMINASDCQIKITDFNLAKYAKFEAHTPASRTNFRNSSSRKNRRNHDKWPTLTEYVCTRWYRAPEIMLCSRHYDSKIDLWSLGCIASELYHRKPIFKGKNHIEMLQLMFHYLGTPDDTSWILATDARVWIESLKSKSGKIINSWLPTASQGGMYCFVILFMY